MKKLKTRIMKNLKITLLTAFFILVLVLIYKADKKATKQAVFDAAWEEQARIHNNYKN